MTLIAPVVGFEQLPCPAEIAERAAMIEESTGLDRVEAWECALKEVGVEGSEVFVAWHRRVILSQLDALPRPNDDRGFRLIAHSVNFTKSGHFERAVCLGWRLEELFGVSSHAKLEGEGLGLVVALAFPLWPRRLEAILSDHAVVSSKAGAAVVWRRFGPDLDCAVVWWRHPGVMGWEGVTL